MPNLKRFFENSGAVSPVIGVVLMVAITVILAAAIGASVFGEGTTESAPQANIQMQTNGTLGVVIIEHLGGDPVRFNSNTSDTNVTAYNPKNGSTEYPDATGFNTFSVGDTEYFTLRNVSHGDTINIKIIDIKAQQLICEKDLRF